MTPRGSGTTAVAAPSQRRSGLGWGGPGLGPEEAILRCARIFRIAAGSCSVAISGSRPPQCGHARTSKLQRGPGEESATIHRRASPSASSCGTRCRHLPAFGSGTVGCPQRVRTAFKAQSRTSPGRHASAPSTLVAAAPAGPTPSRLCGRRRSACALGAVYGSRCLPSALPTRGSRSSPGVERRLGLSGVCRLGAPPLDLLG